MPALKMAESGDHQRQFQAAVDVIQNLPKNGSYRPSYEVMLRFYGLYKQAVCGPCTVSRPGFWDPVGRYKWDAWKRLGDMSSETAMAAYVDEMKRVAQEVIDTMPMDERTASFFHYFEPLYKVIHDMPRPPDSLLGLQADINANDQTTSLVDAEQEVSAQVGSTCTDQDRVDEVSHPVAPELGEGEQDPSLHPPEPDTVSSDGVALTSDSESEIYCDTVEQLESGKLESVPVPDVLDSRPAAHSTEPDGYQGLHVATPVSRVTEMGVGEGGEGGEGGGGQGRGGPPMRRRGAAGRDAARQPARDPRGGGFERDAPHADRVPLGVGGGGEDGSGGSERLQEAQVQQQIVLALRRLREDMRSVMDRLEVVESLAAANAQSSNWRTRTSPAVIEAESEWWWWPFDVSGRTLLLLLLWPFFAQGLVFLLQRRRRRKPHVPT